jgi:hypothetical protein
MAYAICMERLIYLSKMVDLEKDLEDLTRIDKVVETVERSV